MPLRPATRPFASVARRPLHLGRPSFTPSLAHPQQQERPSSSRPHIPGGTPPYDTEQAVPIGPYYQTILIRPQPVPDVKPEQPPSTSRNNNDKQQAPNSRENDDKIATSTPLTTSSPSSSGITTRLSAEPATPEEKARIIFGSRLAGPKDRAERLAAMRDSGTVIAGIRVPPRPEEPDNCCMSGCVNCVWDRFRDDMEDWASASTRAEEAMQKQRAQGSPEVLGSASAVKGMPAAPASHGTASTSAASPPAGTTMDEDGGGSDTNWESDSRGQPKIAKNLWEEDIYKNVPVGIREFMKQEKRLKDKHAQEGTFGA